jgi:glycosyltransferase involved in cell wall biosynthesis
MKKNTYQYANRLSREKKSEASSVLLELIYKNPFFSEYYVSYAFSTKTLPEDIVQLARKNLSEIQFRRLITLQYELRSIEYGSSIYKGEKISFCIPVKNRSKVLVEWNGISRKKTFVTSYKNKPVSFELSLLKNCISSIVNSRISGIDFEIVIADFNSDDDSPSEWMGTLVSPDIPWKVITPERNFNRGHGRNIAASHATGSVLFFLDADMLISRELIQQSLHLLKKGERAFFPICYSYLTPFHKEGWVRSEGWGNLVISRKIYTDLGLSWWEKASWGSEDDHMRDQLKDLYFREEGLNFFHQWHPEDDFKLKYDDKKRNKFNIVIGVTTYNRISYLKDFIESWDRTRNRYYKWTLIVSDDGSTDGTIEYLDNLFFDDCKVNIIKHQRTGIHESSNSIFDRCIFMDFDYAFKCDDDVKFLQSGWDDAYIDGMNEYEYLCNYSTGWRPSKVYAETEKCIAYSNAYYSQGAFFAFTKAVLNKVGWFDSKSFGFKGYGHIDFSVRACRAGFNKFDTLFDIKNSAKFIGLQLEDYIPAMSQEQIKNEFGLHVDEAQKEKMRKKILEERKGVIYVSRNSIYEYPKSVKSPKIHFIIHNNHIGGAEYVHFCHAIALKNAGSETVIWSVGSGYFFDRFKTAGFVTHHLPALFESDSEDWKKFEQTIADGDFIYNCNAYNDQKFFDLSRKKFIYYHTIVHSDVDWIIEHQKKFRYFTHRYIAIHKPIAESLLKSGIASDKIKVINNNLEPGFSFHYDKSLDRSLRTKIGISEESVVVGFVGRIAKDKNALDLIDIFDELLQHRSDVVCLIVGGRSTRPQDQGYSTQFDEKLTSAINGDRIINMGEVLGSELEGLLNIFDVAVNVSPSEGLPISMLEQLAKGIYCVYPGFSAIRAILSECQATVLDIRQRKDGKDLQYTSDEKAAFVETLRDLRKEDLDIWSPLISQYAEDNFSSNVLNTLLPRVFFHQNTNVVVQS